VSSNVRRTSLLALCALVAAATADAQTAPDWERARAAIERGELDDAERIIEGADAGAVGPEPLYFRAAIADQRGDYARALAGYRALLAAHAGSRYGGRAFARLEDLERRGDAFELMGRLDRLRRDARRSPSDLEALERAATSAPAGATRDEALLFVGDAMLDRLSRPAAAAAVFARVARDPRCSAAAREHAMMRLLQARTQTGDVTTAASELRALGAPAHLQTAARTMARRVRLGAVARVWMGAVVAIGVVSMLRARARGSLAALGRRWARPLPWVQLSVLTAGGALVGRYTDAHDLAPFAIMGAGAAAVLLSALAWNHVGPRATAARVTRALVCAGAVLSASYLAMLTRDPMMLEGIGL
jgi:hypothetical protein